MKTVCVHYQGRVQGVGFRWTAKHIARGFDVTGSVENLPDGRVRLVAQGESDEVEGFLEAVRTSGLAGHIATETTEKIPRIPGLRGFEIVA